MFLLGIAQITYPPPGTPFRQLGPLFSDVKIQDLKDSQKENDCKNVGCGEGRVIYKQPILVHLLCGRKRLLLLTKNALLEKGPKIRHYQT